LAMARKNQGRRTARIKPVSHKHGKGDRGGDRPSSKTLKRVVQMEDWCKQVIQRDQDDGGEKKGDTGQFKKEKLDEEGGAGVDLRTRGQNRKKWSSRKQRKGERPVKKRNHSKGDQRHGGGGKQTRREKTAKTRPKKTDAAETSEGREKKGKRVEEQIKKKKGKNQLGPGGEKGGRTGAGQPDSKKGGGGWGGGGGRRQYSGRRHRGGKGKNEAFGV